MISYPYHRGQKWSGKCLSVKCNWRPEQRLPSRIRFRLAATFAHFGFCSLMPGFRCPMTLLGSFCKKHLVSFLDLKIIISNKYDYHWRRLVKWKIERIKCGKNSNKCKIPRSQIGIIKIIVKKYVKKFNNMYSEKANWSLQNLQILFEMYQKKSSEISSYFWYFSRLLRIYEL